MAKASTPLHKRVSIRRAGRVIRNVLTQSLVQEIREGRLKENDEISADDKGWIRLDQHYQLAKFFTAEASFTTGNLRSDINQHLTEISKMLKEINQ